MCIQDRFRLNPKMETSMPFKPSPILFALTLSLGAMLAGAGPVAKAAPAKSQAAAGAPAAAPATGSNAPAAAPAVPGEASESTVVLIGKSGSRYHLKGCRY